MNPAETFGLRMPVHAADAGRVVPTRATSQLIAWDSVGTGAFSHLIHLYFDRDHGYMLRDVIALQDALDDVVFDVLHPIDDAAARWAFATLREIVAAFDGSTTTGDG